MADEPATPPSDETAAPAPAPPSDQVTIGLGPDLGIYPDELRPAETPPAEPPAAPEAAPPEPPETPPEAAGPAPAQGSRRRANEDAYQRGLTEGRAALEQEIAQRTALEQSAAVQREANQRVEQLFNDLASTDYATSDRARRGILQMYSGNQQAQALMQTTRQQVLAEMAADFAKLQGLDGITDADYQTLHSAPSAAELAQRAFGLGKKARDDQVARLEAEIEGLRGRLVGSRATPERANGGTTGSNLVSLDQYRAMSPTEARKLTPAQIDALTAQLAVDAEHGH